MKKIRNIGLMMGLMILLSSYSNAQHFYTSFGYAHDWNLPRYIGYSIQDNYYGYDIAHVQRYSKYGHTNFNVLLHRNGLFVELRYDQHGHIYRTIRHDYYPLMSHSCTNRCGYHHNYYNTYYATYHHKHYKHKHRKTVYVNTHNGHGNYKHNKHNSYYTNVYVEKPQKKQSHYKSNQQTQNSVNKRSGSQQQRSSTVTRKPQQTTRRVEYKRPQGNSNANRIQQSKSKQRSARPATTTSRSKQTLAYKSGRSSRDR